MTLLNVAIAALFVIVCMAALLGLILLFTKGLMRLADDWVEKIDLKNYPKCGKILKTRLELVLTLPREEETSIPPYESSAVVVHTKTEFIRMAGYWWDHRIPGQTTYDKFEAISQPGK